jgi:hypothetical protein
VQDNWNMDNESSTSPESPRPVSDPVVYSADIEEKRRICAEQDRSREELRRRIGTVNIAVDLIRSLRDDGE